MSRLKLHLGKRDTWSLYHIPRSVLRAWWCADDHGSALMTDDGAGLISSWKDRINALEVTAATTARPTWTNNGFNTSYDGMVFDGTANHMLMASLDSRIPSGANPGTLIVVGDPGVIGATNVAASYGANGAGTRRQMFQSSTGETSASTGGSGMLVEGADNSWIAPSAIVAQFEAALITLWQDSTLIGTVAGTLNTTATKLVIGASASTTPSQFFGGSIRHVLIFADVLTTIQRQQIEGYLAWDSGLVSLLPSSHPYKLVPP